MSSERHPMIASRDDAVLVVVDVQEKLFPVICEKETLSRRICALVEGASILGLPILLSEQYAEGLGKTIGAVSDQCGGVEPIQKNSFSCLGEETFAAALRDTGRRQVLVCGIETHICVMQTCLDCIAEGYDTFVVTDATGTRLSHTHDGGIQRISAAGGLPVTVEGVLFEMMERCDTDAFKSILTIVRKES